MAWLNNFELPFGKSTALVKMKFQSRGKKITKFSPASLSCV